MSSNEQPVTRNAYAAWFFAAAGAIALILGVVFTLRAHEGAVAGLIAGAALLAVAELWLAARSRITANALDAAGIAILYAALYAMRDSLPIAAVFAGMLVVTAVAVFLARRSDALFIAVVGVAGGFVNAYLLSTDPDYPLAVFSYLLALQIAIAWLVIEKRWWSLLALGIVLTTIYEVGWTVMGLNVQLLWIAAAIFLVAGIVGAIPLWHAAGRECPPGYRWMAVVAAHLPLLFAIYVASQVNYAAQYAVLFGYLLLVDAGLLAISWPLAVGRWPKGDAGTPAYGQQPTANSQLLSGLATLITLTLWFRTSYTDAAWPWLLLWAVLFIAVYLARPTVFAGLMFGFFVGLGVHAPAHWAAIVLTMFVSLAVVFYVSIKRGAPMVAAVAIGVSSIALMTMHPPLWTLVALHAILFAEVFVVAWISERHVLAILAVPFLVAMAITAYSPAAWSQYSATTLLAIAAVPYLLFVAYPLVLGARAKASLAPYTAPALASLVVLIVGSAAHRSGWTALAETILMALLLWRAMSLDPREPRLTMMLALTLAFSDIALGALLPLVWSVPLFAVGVVVMIWLFLRVRHPLFALWALGLTAYVFFRLAFDARLFYASWRDLPVYIAVYVACGVAMFAAAYLIRIEQPLLQRVFSVACLFELWFLINLLIANCFHSSNGAVVFDFAASQPGENVLYTVGWAVIATGLLILGYLVRWPAARGAALSLLVASVLKGFLADLPRLQVPYLTVSLVGLGLSVAVVAVVLQRKWIGWPTDLDRPA